MSLRIVRILRGRLVVLLALFALVALAFGLRTVEHIQHPRPLAAAGLAAEQGEMARHIVDDGRWFVLNPQAYELLKQRQAEENRLVDLDRVDFSNVDRETASYPVVDQMPGVAVVLAGLWWVTGEKSYGLIQWLQILLDTAMVLLVYWIARRISRRIVVGLLAGLLYAIWWKAILYANIPVLEPWGVIFTIACVAAFVWAREAPEDRRRLLLLGVLAGLGLYFRPFVVLLPVALALAATPGGGWRRRMWWAAAPTAVALLILSPWAIRNYYEFHRFIPFRTGLGQAVFEGSGLAANGDESAKAHVRQRSNARYGTPKYDNELLTSAYRAITSDPGGYARRVGYRLRFLAPCLLLVLVWRRWRTGALIPVAAAVATVVPYVFIGDDRRYYQPMFFAYFILVAMAAYVLVSFLFGSRSLIGRTTSRIFGSAGRVVVAHRTNPDGRTRPE